MEKIIILKVAAIFLFIASSPVLCDAQENDDSQGINPGDFISESNRFFKNWNRGEAEIVAVVLSEQDQSKRDFSVGTIEEDGRFDFQMSEAVRASVPINVYTQRCTNREEAVLDGQGVKLAFVVLYATQHGEYIGSVNPAMEIKAAYNVNEGNINNGNMGRYFMWIYADGDASVRIDCKKTMDMTDGKEVEYKDMEVEDRIHFQFRKGLNLIRAEVVDNIWVGLTKHYQKREWSVVSDFPGDVKWVFRAVPD